MHSINALELPEITKIIASYLSDLKPCLAVCKAWRSLYLPLYWYEVEAGDLIPKCKYHPLFFDPIHHGHYCKFIRVLTVYGDFGAIDKSLYYPTLRRLRLHCPGDEKWSRLDEQNPVLRNFLKRHPLLECLDLHAVPLYIMISAWATLVNHPRLEEVILECQSPAPSNFWIVCARLKRLQFSYIPELIQGRIPKNLSLPSIRRLSLTTLNNRNVMEELDIIAACPLLEDLVWVGGGFYEHPVWARFGQLAKQGTWPHLQQLSLASGTEDADLSQVIASMHQATKIDIRYGPFGPLSFTALQRHAGTLQYLHIASEADSRMIRDVLCSFTRLEHLRTPLIYAKDIADGGPWACTSLRKMSVMVAFSSGEDNLQPVVFERMSRLVHLEEFDNYSNHFYGSNHEHGLILRLQAGMAALTSLSRLRHVKLDDSSQKMDFDDARWIIDHWKRLETIQGRLSQDRSMRNQLEDFFNASGIKILPWL